MDRFGQYGFLAVKDNCSGNVLIRTDADHVKGLSTGHMYRCLSIADYLMENDYEVSFLSRGYPLAREILGKAQYEKIFFPIDEDGTDEMGQLEWDTLIADYPSAHKDFALFPKRGKLIWIDDAGMPESERLLKSVDAVINPSVVETNRKYPNNGETEFFLGGDYFFPNRDLQKISQQRDEIINPDEITVFMGGTDPFGYSALVMPEVCRLGNPVNLIVGGGNKRKDELKKLANEQVEVHIGPKNAAEKFLYSKLAVVSGGLVAYEAWYLGIPAVILPTTEIEEQNRNAFYAMIEQKIEGPLLNKWHGLAKVLGRIKGEPSFQ